MKTFFAICLTVCALFGVLDASYVSLAKTLGFTPTCHPPFDCETVLRSHWAHVGPLPLSAFGVLFYTMVTVLSAFAVLEIDELSLFGHTLRLRSLLFSIGVFGAAFSTYLLTIMGAVLHAWCLYCLLSAINCMIIFVMSSGFFFTSRKERHALRV